MRRVIYAIGLFGLCITLIFLIDCLSENTGKSKEATSGQDLGKLIRQVRDMEKKMYAENRLKEQKNAFDNLEFGEDADTVKKKLDEQSREYDKVFGAAARLKISEAKYSMRPIRTLR
jgi:hypothetical protein